MNLAGNSHLRPDITVLNRNIRQRGQHIQLSHGSSSLFDYRQTLLHPFADILIHLRLQREHLFSRVKHPVFQILQFLIDIPFTADQRLFTHPFRRNLADK